MLGDQPSRAGSDWILRLAGGWAQALSPHMGVDTELPYVGGQGKTERCWER